MIASILSLPPSLVRTQCDQPVPNVRTAPPQRTLPKAKASPSTFRMNVYNSNRQNKQNEERGVLGFGVFFVLFLFLILVLSKGLSSLLCAGDRSSQLLLCFIHC